MGRGWSRGRHNWEISSGSLFYLPHGQSLIHRHTKPLFPERAKVLFPKLRACHRQCALVERLLHAHGRIIPIGSTYGLGGCEELDRPLGLIPGQRDFSKPFQA